MPALRAVVYRATAISSAAGTGPKYSIVTPASNKNAMFRYIEIRNIDASADLEINFGDTSGGQQWFLLKQGTTNPASILKIPCYTRQIFLRGVGATADYCMVTNEG